MKRYNVRVGLVAGCYRELLTVALQAAYLKTPAFVPHTSGGFAVVLTEVTRFELIGKVTNFIRGFNAAITTRPRPNVVRCNGAANGLHGMGKLGRHAPRPKRYAGGKVQADRRLVRKEEREQEYDLGRIG